MATEAAKLFVARLPWTACRISLRKHFQKYGEVTSTRVIFDPKTGRSQGYGFVTFADAESAKSALQAESHEIDGKKVFLQDSSDREKVHTNHEDKNDVNLHPEQQ